MHSDKIIIGFDAKRALCNSTGLGSYSRTLINDLVLAGRAEQRFAFNLYSPDEGKAELRNQLLKDGNLNFMYPKHKNIKLWGSLWREKYVVNTLKQDGVRIFHGLSGQLPAGIKGKGGIKSIVTIHDVIFLIHPEFYNPVDVCIYRQKFFSALKQADKIIAVSQCTKRDILRFGNMNASKPIVTEDKIEVIYQSYNKVYDNAVSREKQRELKQRLSLPDKFILNVGTIERRKNILLGVKALNGVNKDIHLVIVGRSTPYAKEIETYAQKHGLADRVHIYNNVNNEDLNVIYSLALMFVYPSLYEGFGIPIIEAVAHNLPVIAAKGSCLEEAAGQSAYYVNACDGKELADVVNMLCENEDKRLLSVNGSKKYIERFKGNNITDRLFDIYTHII
ncbi:MAG: glycosyltransferase family 4 protein [Bacteroidales bacterium]|nr:glycosyltransferase family 4 protein [Bacteroidales bacterium]